MSQIYYKRLLPAFLDQGLLLESPCKHNVFQVQVEMLPQDEPIIDNAFMELSVFDAFEKD